MRKKLTVEVVGSDDSDLEFGLEEVLRLVKEAFTSGQNSNGSGSFLFVIDDWPLGSERKASEKKPRVVGKRIDVRG